MIVGKEKPGKLVKDLNEVLDAMKDRGYKVYVRDNKIAVETPTTRAKNNKIIEEKAKLIKEHTQGSILIRDFIGYEAKHYREPDFEILL